MASRRTLRGWRRWVFPLVAATLVPALTLVGLEAGLRLGGYGHPVGFFLEVDGRPSLRTPNPRFGWRFFPPALARTPVVSRFDHPKPPDTYRIFVLGGSAALGTPDSSFSFGRILEVLLEAQHPGVDVEVVNAAMTATNSHVARIIAAEAARYQPDAFAVYLGNNEVVGPFGPGSIFGGFRPSLGTVRASLWLRGTRIGQLLHRLASGLGGGEGAAPERWRGMEHFLDSPVAADDPRLEDVYRHFQANLEAVVAAGSRAGTEVFVSTVATNLVDNPPFASRGTPGVPSDQRVSRAGEILARETADGAAQAEVIAREGLAEDPGHAGLHEILGQARRRLGGEALPHLARARDLDVLRFRADHRLNEILRRLPESTAAHGVDGETALAEASPDGLLGEAMLYEHVHLRFAGNRALAEAFAAAISPDLRRRYPEAAPAGAVSADPAAALAFTAWDRARLEASMVALRRRPPFPGQRGHQERLAREEDRLRTLQQEDRTRRDTSLEVYARAVEARPEALELRARHATLLLESGLPLPAVREWRALLERLPGVAAWHSQLGFALADAGDADAGLAEQRRATELAPWSAAAWSNLGSAFQAAGRPENARDAYLAALERDPAYPWARLALGHLALEAGDPDTAEAEYRRVLAREPDSVDAELGLGEAALRRGETAAARVHLRRAVELAPDRAEVWNRLGLAQEAEGLLTRAAESFRRALEADPQLAVAAFNLGDALLAQGRFRAAANAYQQALTLDPDNPQGRANLAVAKSGLQPP